MGSISVIHTTLGGSIESKYKAAGRARAGLHPSDGVFIGLLLLGSPAAG